MPDTRPGSIGANAGLLFAGLASFILMGAGQSVYGPALPALSRSFGIGIADAGLIVSAHWLGCAVGVAAMFWRPLLGPRLSLAAMTAGAGLIALAPGWAVTLAGAAVFGAGYGAATVAYNPRFLRRFAARGPAMLSLLNASFGIGAIAAPLLFLALGADVRLCFGLLAGLCALVWLGAGRTGSAEAAPRGTGFRPGYGFLSFGVLAIGVEASLIGLGPAALIALGVTETRAAELLSLFFVAFLGVRIGLVVLAGLMAPFTLFTVALVLAGAGAVGAVTLSPAIFFVVMGVSAGLFFPLFYVCATARMGDDPRVAPTIIAAGLVGGIVLPPVLGLAMAAFGAGVFFWIVALVMCAAAVVAAGLHGSVTRTVQAR